jgi:hypothetical protein
MGVQKSQAGLKERKMSMIDELAKRLRAVNTTQAPYANEHVTGLCHEAAARIEQLEAALRFYADKTRYDNDTQIDRGDGTFDASCSILDDEGRIARAALGEKA